MKLIWLALFVGLQLSTGCKTTEPSGKTIESSELDLSGYSELVVIAYGLSCPLCANNLDRQLAKVNGVERATIDLNTGAVILQLTEGHSVTPSQLRAAVDDAGFTLKEIQPRVSAE